MQCLSCGHRASAGHKFCGSCGAALERKGLRSDWVKNAANIATDAGKKAKQIAEQTAEAMGKRYQESGAKSTIEGAASWTNEQLDRTGVSGAARSVSDAAGEALDTASGKKILELVEERLALQARYNDVLATKLEEALARIAALEDSIKERP